MTNRMRPMTLPTHSRVRDQIAEKTPLLRQGSFFLSRPKKNDPGFAQTSRLTVSAKKNERQQIQEAVMKNTKKVLSLIGLLLVVAVPSYAQRTFPVPTYHPPAQTYHPPAQTYHPPAQTHRPPEQTPRPAAQPTPHPAAQTQPHPAKQQPAAQGTTGSTPQPQHQASQPRPPAAPSRAEVQKQEKAQARAQREQQKQNQKQQKEQARQQKEQQKQQKNNQKAAKPAKDSKRSESRDVAKAPATASGDSKATSSANASEARIQQLNSARSNMSGINRKPLPAGELTVHSNGRMTLNADGGRQYGLRSNGTVASYSDREKTVSFDQRGKVGSIHTANMDIHNGAHGQRTIISRRADGSKVVSIGRHSGYVERNVVMNNRTYVQRTTVINNRVYTRTFVGTSFGGVAFVPPVFFAPRFYGWAYYPWAAPISFSWGWFGATWYVGPNPYFVASPVYPSAAFWLTDYTIGETLAAAYHLRHDAEMADEMMDDESAEADSADVNTSADGEAEASSDPSSDQPDTLLADVATPITPEVKAAIAEEVKQELASDNVHAVNPSQASFDSLPSVLRQPNHVFIVSSDLDVTTTDQQLCALQAGDTLQPMSPAAADSGLVELRVASSKRRDCPAGVRVNVSLTDLQEMQNSFLAHIEEGLGKLHDSQGSAGLPSAPPDVVAAPPRPAMTGLDSVAAADSAAILDQEREQADQAEREAAKGAF
jgi:hypothetical protein